MRPDPDPFLEALQPHYDDALRYVRGLCAKLSVRDAEDAVQAGLLRAFEAFGSLRDPARFRPWLFQILTREVYGARRRAFWRRFVPLVETPAALALFTDSVDATDLLAALARLGDREREALLLYEVGGFRVDEIRALQGDRSASAVKSRLARARSRLRDLLDEAPAPPVPSTRAA